MTATVATCEYSIDWTRLEVYRSESKIVHKLINNMQLLARFMLDSKSIMNFVGRSISATPRMLSTKFNLSIVLAIHQSTW